MTSSKDKLTGQQFTDLGLEQWVYLLGGIQTRIRTGDFVTGLRVVNEIGAAAEEMNHHPDLDLRYPYVDVRLSSHDVGGVTDRDVTLARRIGEIAAAAGVALDGDGQTRFELGLDSPDQAAVLPFWSAVLRLDPVKDEIYDKSGAVPTIWFQESGSEEPRQRWHPDVWVDPAEVQPRIDAALAAGGTLVTDEWAPRFWVLADPQGNKVCLCTWHDRGA